MKSHFLAPSADLWVLWQPPSGLFHGQLPEVSLPWRQRALWKLHICAAPHSTADKAGRTVSRQPWLSGATSCCTLFSSSEMRTKSGREESSTILVFGLRNFRVIYFHFSSTIGIFIKHCWKLTIQTREKALLWGDSSSFSWINSPYIETRLESPQRLMQQSYPCPP